MDEMKVVTITMVNVDTGEVLVSSKKSLNFQLGLQHHIERFISSFVRGLRSSNNLSIEIVVDKPYVDNVEQDFF